MHITTKTGGLLLLAALATGCVQAPPQLYQWDAYQPSVYQHYQADSANLSEQIHALEQAADKAQARGMSVPPGMHAHLGMLYYNVGREQDAHAQFAAEKALFPESTHFMNYILKAQKDVSQ